MLISAVKNESSMIRMIGHCCTLKIDKKMAPVSLIVLEGELHHLTVYEGQDWVGRGELKNSEIQGQIYAYIAFIGKMKEELQNE